MTRASVIAAALLLLLIARSQAGHTTPDRILRTVKIFDLLEAYPQAAKKVAGPTSVSRDTFSINDDVRPGMMLHPSGVITFPQVRVSPKAVLTFTIGVLDTAWDKPGDGVQFNVIAYRLNGAATRVFSRYLDPKHEPTDRQWFEHHVPLSTFGNQDIRIAFATDPGPTRDTQFDWAVWADAQLILPITD